jgi:hypothetical protein
VHAGAARRCAGGRAGAGIGIAMRRAGQQEHRTSTTTRSEGETSSSAMIRSRASRGGVDLEAGGGE